MTTDLVILVGPMNASQLGQVAWQRPTKVVTLSQGPDGYSDQDGRIGPGAFAALWQKFGSIEAVAASVGIDELGSVGLIAFSAGWAFADPALGSGRVDGALLLDACFAPAPGFSTLVKPGYRAFAAAAARGERLLVLTGGPGGRYHTGAACVWQQVEGLANGWSSWQPPTSPGPVRAETVGALYAAEYGANVAHGAHVSVLGRPLADELLAPWLAGGPRWSPAKGLWIAAGSCAAAALLFYHVLRGLRLPS